MAAFLSGKSQLVGRGVIQPTPIADDAAAHAGGVMVGDDGVLHVSDGTDWRALTDEARAAEIANDIAAETTRPIPADYQITVGAGGDYPDLLQALTHLATFTPRIATTLTQAQVRILTGTTLTTQISLLNVHLGWVNIVSDDAIVDVDCTGWVQGAPFFTSIPERHFMLGVGSTFPRLGTKLRVVGARPAHGVVLLRAHNSQFFNYPGPDETFTTPTTYDYTSGLLDADINMLLDSGSTARINRMQLTGATQWSLAMFNSEARLDQSLVRGDKSIVAQLASRLTMDAVDFRATAGVDSADDLVMLQGCFLHMQGGAIGQRPFAANTIDSTGKGIFFENPA